MRLSVLTLLALSAAVLAQLRQPAVIEHVGQVDIERPVAMTIRLGSEDTASFRVSQRVVTDIDLHVRGADYSVPLQCAGGLHDVNFATVELWLETADTFSLLFDMGNEQQRKFGKLPRMQVGFSRGRLDTMLLTTMTSERSGGASKLCSSLPVESIKR